MSVKWCDQQLITTVYWKPTHTDHYLNYGSNHHPRIKSGIVKCLAHRAREVCQPDLVKTELNHLQQVLESNNYPPALVRRCLKKQRMRDQMQNETVEEEPRICCLPYCDVLWLFYASLYHFLLWFFVSVYSA